MNKKCSQFMIVGDDKYNKEQITKRAKHKKNKNRKRKKYM